MRIICRFTVHERLIPEYLSWHCTGISPNQFSNFSKTFTFFVVFPYTTTLFYGKMMVVHIFLLGVYFFGLTYYTRDLYELFLFSSGVALESIIHLALKKARLLPCLSLGGSEGIRKEQRSCDGIGIVQQSRHIISSSLRCSVKKGTAVAVPFAWRKRRDSNPCTDCSVTAFRVRAVVTTSIRFHGAFEPFHYTN